MSLQKDAKPVKGIKDYEKYRLKFFLKMAVLFLVFVMELLIVEIINKESGLVFNVKYLVPLVISYMLGSVLVAMAGNMRLSKSNLFIGFTFFIITILVIT